LPKNINAPAEASSGSISLTTTEGCDWIAESGIPWVTLIPAKGSGAATVQYTMQANAASQAREGVLHVADTDVTVTQAAHAEAPPPTPLPEVSIGSATVTEGNDGTVAAVFTASLSAKSSETVTVTFATEDATATAGSDYVAASGTITFDPGVTTRPLSIMVDSDTLVESDETFTVRLLSATNATLSDSASAGRGTIRNDDEAPPPQISINDVRVIEGNDGTVQAVFTVTLSAASPRTVTVVYSTADPDDTAIGGRDYVPAKGTVEFAPGVTTREISVTVNGDIEFEPDELFTVVLQSPTNATISDGAGTGTIANDDPG